MNVFDAGSAMQQRENVLTSRSNREISQGRRQDEIEDRELAKVQRTKDENKETRTNALRRIALNGEGDAPQGAIKQLMEFDPQAGAETYDMIRKMDANELAQAEQNLNTVGTILANIQQAPQEQRAEKYRYARQELGKENPELIEGTPEQYDPNFVDFILARTGLQAQSIEDYKVLTFGDQDMLVSKGKGGSSILAQTESADSIKQEKTTSLKLYELEMEREKAFNDIDSGLSAAEENSMFKAVTKNREGLDLDSDQGISAYQNLSQSKRDAITETIAKAARIKADNPRLTLSEAVLRAIKGDKKSSSSGSSSGSRRFTYQFGNLEPQ